MVERRWHPHRGEWERSHGCDPLDDRDWSLARRGAQLLVSRYHPPGKKEGDREWTAGEFVERLEGALNTIAERRRSAGGKKLGGAADIAADMSIDKSTLYDYLKMPELAWLRAWWDKNGGARELIRRWRPDINMRLFEEAGNEH